MSEIKHTPGPWIVMPEESENSYVRIRGSLLGERYKVANVLTPVYPGAQKTELEETRANARLIAAAPELLEALQSLDKRFRLCMEHCVTASEAYDSFYQEIVSEAIAKATGAA